MVTSFAVYGDDATTSYTPDGQWFLEGSNDDLTWMSVYESPFKWAAGPGFSYPPSDVRIVQSPGMQVLSGVSFFLALCVLAWPASCCE